eukprot:s1451_g2.t1
MEVWGLCSFEGWPSLGRLFYVRRRGAAPLCIIGSESAGPLGFIVPYCCRRAMAPSPGWLAWAVLTSAPDFWLCFGPCTSRRCPHGIFWEALPPLGRHERRQLTRALSQTWAAMAPSPDLPLGFGLWYRQPFSCFPCRASKHLHPKQRVTWDRRLQRRYDFAGIRVGEASHPGPPNSGSASTASLDQPPAAMEVDGGQPALARVFCPVAGCPDADSSRARGWANHASMRGKSPLTGSRPRDGLVGWFVASVFQFGMVCTPLATHPSGLPLHHLHAMPSFYRSFVSLLAASAVGQFSVAGPNLLGPLTLTWPDRLLPCFWLLTLGASLCLFRF